MDDWDNIDWDEKVDNLIKSQKDNEENKNEPGTSKEFKFGDEDNGNYFEKIKPNKESPKSKVKTSKKSSEHMKVQESYIQPYSQKDLMLIRDAIRNKNVHNSILSTFGEWEKFLLTHEMNLNPEKIVDLLIIDVSLLDIPFNSHNKLFLSKLSNIEVFWSELLNFLKDFFRFKHKDLKFLLAVDMNEFFRNIDLLIFNLLLNNLFNENLKTVFDEIILIMNEFNTNKWSQPAILSQILNDYERNQNELMTYEIYPQLSDLTKIYQKFHKNIVIGEYENVSHYLQVQLPLLKEDFMNKLRDGVQNIKTMTNVDKIIKSSNVVIYPNVCIKAVKKFLWNMNCRMIVVEFNQQQNSKIDWNRRLFNGQMLCFSTSQDFNDLIVAVVLNRDLIDHQQNEIFIEIISTENVDEIFNRSLIMLEPTSFFEPYHRVFNVIKNYNELNFPFKDQIIHLKKISDFPSYPHSKQFTYKNFSFNIENINDWPSHDVLHLENMQLKAIQKAVTSKLTVVQGPPGTGKTFIGLEILKIILENTNEIVLVLTQTNNALDKFLIGASKFSQDIIRMGGQSKASEVEHFVAKSTTSLESKRYMKKLQAQNRDIVAKLINLDDNQDEIYQTISRHQRMIEEIHQMNLFSCLNGKRIIGMTTTFAARNTAINKMLKPGIIIIEEASEVLESHVLVSLTSETKQLIMIGDHQQLRPLTNSFELARIYNFNVSLFERLIRNDFDFITLDVQMRMRPEICDLVRGTIYKSLTDGDNVVDNPKVKGLKHNFYCLEHSYPESIGDGETSKENLFEADYVMRLCKYLISCGNPIEEITILTAYAAQAQRLRKLLKESEINVRVAVLDAYQGEESEIILLSLVRSNEKGDIGFLASENRIAVLLSRAKFGFYIIANMKCLANASPIWKKVRDIMKDKKLLGDKIPDVL
ncbi:CLUMA_CG009085, isoform A [Clunio marinus]|uniref:CLUMA_CG009085, isoform A n=1 Tax=Clunio marinus TaxID=568069 RepID=A0A1J1I611_9DIPT|nr:CLUMA_CG009085, isoform A [Clunio marinus]